MFPTVKRFAILAVLMLAPVAGMFGHVPMISRGPYLQQGSDTSVVVRWRTSHATESRVWYGTSADHLALIATGDQVTTEHVVKLVGLTPDTHYYYRVDTGSNGFGAASGDFYTAPKPGTVKATRIWILGDSGSGRDNARRVRDAYYDFSRDRRTDFWVLLGDNAYHAGRDEEYQHSVFENMYEQMLRRSVLWTTIGNHDVKTRSNPGPYPYYDIFTLPKTAEGGGVPSGTEAYYSFDYGNIHIISLNSSIDSLRVANSAMWRWLKQDLAANDKLWTIAFWHHAPYSKGSHDSDVETPQIEMRERALPVLEDGGVDLVITGHSHAYERSFLLDGYYGSSESLTDANILDRGDGNVEGGGAYTKPSGAATAHQGTVYVVCGASSKIGKGRLDHPAMATSLRVLGSLVLDIDGNRLDARFLDEAGSIRDHFTLLKKDTLESPTGRHSIAE